MTNFYLGIDVSKGHADFILLDENKYPVDDGFQLDDTAGGHKSLHAYLCNFFQTHPQATIYAAVESTGGYENNWYRFLKSLIDDLPIQVARLNAFWVSANAKAGGKRNKTDPISAKDVAEYLISHPERVRYNISDGYPMLRRQWSYIKLLKKQSTQLRNHFESVLYNSMPELLSFCKDGVPAWLITLIHRYPTYDAMHRAGVGKLSKIAYISAEKAQTILKRIQSAHGQSDAVSGQVLRSITSQIQNGDKLITQQKKHLEKNYAEAQREVQLLTTFTGIGVYSAVGLLLNIGDVSNFDTVKKLASFLGVHPIYRQSGDGSFGYQMSKQGRAEGRALLYMICFSAIRFNPIIKGLYTKCLKKGMHKSAALGVCMHKTLRIVYGMLKNNTPFDPEVDRKNRKTHGIENRPTKPDKKRRLQSYDQQAPISRRQHKKRKEQTSPQDEIVANSGVKETAPTTVES